jgi:hypothetical protein
MSQISKHYQKTRLLAVVALVIGVVGMGVAFAALSTTLYITGSAKVDSADWDVRWENLACTTTGEASISPTTAISSDFHTITVNAVFVAPNDKVTCLFDAINEGGMDAVLDHNLFVENTSDLSGAGDDGGVSATLTYRSNSGGAADGDDVGAASLDLPVGSAHQMQLELINTNSTFQETTISKNFSFSIPYTQKTK